MVYKIVGDTGYLFICISKVCRNKACSNTANSPTVTQQPADELLLLLLLLLLLKCCFTSTETVGLLGTGAQDDHLDFHTAPELWAVRIETELILYPRRMRLMFMCVLRRCVAFTVLIISTQTFRGR